MVLQMRRITKRFGGTVALRNVDFDCKAGEVHALVGENGAGKSTLMKILAGVVHPDEGEILLDGAAVRIFSPIQSRSLGIAVIYQELNLVPNLTAAENIMLGHEPVSRLGALRRRQLVRQAEEILEELECRLDLTRLVRDLSVAEQQLVEIAKALSMEARLVIMDEPTAPLLPAEVERLFKQIRRLKDNGRTVIFISHRLNEVFSIADRITVLKDGQRVATVSAGEVSQDDIVRMMVGRQVTELFPRRAGRGEKKELLRVTLGGRGSRDIVVRAGEVVALWGLEGQGQRELVRHLFGLEPNLQTEVRVEGTPVKVRSPRHAMRLGLAFLSDDRKGEGLFVDLTIRANISLPILAITGRLGIVTARREAEWALSALKGFDLRARSVLQRIRELSGGNQQKVALAKSIVTRPKILMLHEPSRGVDVGARTEVYRIIRSLADRGTGVLMVSSDLKEVLGLSDRVLVVRSGTVVAEFDAANCTEEEVMAAALPGGELAPHGLAARAFGS